MWVKDCIPCHSLFLSLLSFFLFSFFFSPGLSQTFAYTCRVYGELVLAIFGFLTSGISPLNFWLICWPKHWATKSACFLLWTRSAIFNQQSCMILHSLCHPTLNHIKAGDFHNQPQVNKAIVFADWFGGMVGIGCSLRRESHMVPITILKLDVLAYVQE